MKNPFKKIINPLKKETHDKMDNATRKLDELIDRMRKSATEKKPELAPAPIRKAE